METDTLQDQLDELLNELCHLHHSGQLSNEHYDHLHDQVETDRQAGREKAKQRKREKAIHREQENMLHQLKNNGEVTI